ncbi:glycosyltransferase family 4 protein [Halobacillus shinanisalinarum]|uniref:Glycosyltransferase family 4 protein n=1 Tax=Halobacillus shinanisalinarum TaxID=2932258 RepID=A0ABY4H641_9BACI|nr:glycosyltransferase family 4 protein [Halobacillus shinanisalinarum]UOQ95057.1 glycosyltransferase family 4 protein [Halobacillus shinanisalinarum]
MNKNKIIHMVTVSKSLELMRGQLKFLQENGFNVGIISSPGIELDDLEVRDRISVKMEREISIIRDLKSLLKLIYILAKEKPFILNTGTPKAGLLGVIAAYITRVPNRIYTLRGLKLETAKGLKKRMLWITEKIACFLATDVICISPSLRDEAIKLGLVKKSKTIILGNGSSNGIAVENYPEPPRVKDKVNEIKENLEIKSSDFVIGFVGRIVKDKGVNELVEAFKQLEENNKNIKLLMLGSFENGDPIKSTTRSEIENNKNIIHVGYIKNPSIYYYVMNIFILPTYREGFGNVNIQAQAAQVPVITTDATGTIDTVIDGKTGLIVPIENVSQIIDKINYLMLNENSRMEMGIKGREMVLYNYDSKLIWREMINLYNRMANKNL